MPTILSPVGLDFFERAPMRFVSTELVPHPAGAVFAAIAEDPAGWGDWFPGFSHEGRYITPAPYGVGSTREVVMTGLRFRETVLAWDAPTRWAFRLDQSSLAFAHALAEDYRVVDRGDQSLVQWTLALEPRGVLAYGSEIGNIVVPRVFRRAMVDLTHKLSAAPAAAPPPGAGPVNG